MVVDLNSLKADPDTFMKDLEEYLEKSRNSNNPCLLARAAGKHTQGHVECAACDKERDMLFAIVRGQGMAKLLCEERQKGNIISLKCDRCDYETKLCRQSRAKKHMTSHKYKHHGDEEYISCEASYVGRDGHEASCDEEQSIHGDKKVDKVGTGEGAAVGGNQDGVSPQIVLLAGVVMEEEEQVDHQLVGDVGDYTQDDVLPQAVLLARDFREEEVQVDHQLSGDVGDKTPDDVLSQAVLFAGDVSEEEGQVEHQVSGDVGDDTPDDVLPQAVLLAGDVREEEEQVEQQLGGGSGNDVQGRVIPQAVLLSKDVNGEEEQVDNQAGGATGDGAHDPVLPQVVHLAGNVRGEEEQADNQLREGAGDVATDGVRPQVVLHAGDVSGEKEQGDNQPDGGAGGNAQDAVLPPVALPAEDGRVDEKQVDHQLGGDVSDDTHAKVLPQAVLRAGDVGGKEKQVDKQLAGGAGHNVQDTILPSCVLLARDVRGEEEQVNNLLGGDAGDNGQDRDLPPVVLLAGNIRDHTQVVLLAGDNRGDDGLVRYVDPWETGGGDDDVLSGRGNGQAILHGHGDDPGGQDLGDDPGVNLAWGTVGDLGGAGEEHDHGDDPAGENQQVEDHEAISVKDDGGTVIHINGQVDKVKRECEPGDDPLETGGEGHGVPHTRGDGYATHLDGGEEDPGMDCGIVHQVDPWETGEADYKVSSDRGDDDDHGVTWEKDHEVLGVRYDDPAAQPGEVDDPHERTDHEVLGDRGVGTGVHHVVGGESDSCKAGGEQYPGNKPGDDPGEEGQKVLCASDRGYGHAVLCVCDGQAVQDPGDNPGEEGQQVLGVGGGGLTALVRGEGQPVHRVGGDEDLPPAFLLVEDNIDREVLCIRGSGQVLHLIGGEDDTKAIGIEDHESNSVGRDGHDGEAVQHPGDDPWEEGQPVICVRGGGQAAHHDALGEREDGQAVKLVGDDPAVQDPGEEGQQVFGGRGGGQAAHHEAHGDIGDGRAVLCVGDGQEVLHVSDDQAVLLVGGGQAVQDPGDDPREEGQQVLGVGGGGQAAQVRGDGRAIHHVVVEEHDPREGQEEDMKSVMGEDVMIRRKRKHKGSERRRGSKQERRKHKWKQRRRGRKQERKRRVQRDNQEKKKRRRILIMWKDKKERKPRKKEGSTCSKQGEG